MRYPQSFVLAIIPPLFLSSLPQVVDSSFLDNIGSRPLLLPRYLDISTSSSSLSSNETWPVFPFTVDITTSGPGPEWLRFSYGGKPGTEQQNTVLTTLISKVSSTFASSPPQILNDMKTFGNQDVHILCDVTPLTLTGTSFSDAFVQLANYTKQWGAKEMVFEVGSGPKDSVTEGVFQIRLGPGPLTAGTGISTSLPFSTIMSLPYSTVLNITNSVPGASIATSSPSSMGGGSAPVSALANSTGQSILQPLNTANTSFSSVGTGKASLRTSGASLPPVSGTGGVAHITSNTSLDMSATVTSRSKTSGSSQASLPIGSLSAGCTAGLCPQSSNASIQLAPSSTMKSSILPPLVSGNLLGNSYGVSSTPTDLGGLKINSTSSPTILGTGSTSASTVVQPSTTGTLLPSLPTSTPIPTSTPSLVPGSFTTVFGSTTIESSIGATTTGFTTQDGGSNGIPPIILPIVVPIEVPAVVPVPIVDPLPLSPKTPSNNDSPNDEPPENSDPDQSLDPERQSQTQLSGSQTLTQTSVTPTTAPSTTPQSSVSKSLTQTSVSQTSSTACPTCCPAYTYGQYILPPTTTDEDDEGADDAALTDSDSDTDDGNLYSRKRSLAGQTFRGSSQPVVGRSLAGRFSFLDRKSTLEKRKGGGKNTIGSCPVGDYNAKPGYPKAKDIAQWDGKSTKNGYARFQPFFETAKFWAIPADVPIGSCAPPTWALHKTEDLGTMKSPGPYGFVDPGDASERFVNIDHVYEAKLLTEFMNSVVRKKQVTCDDIKNNWDVPAGEEPRSPQAGGQKKGFPSRLALLFSNLATYDHGEFVGMDEKMNTLKGIITNFKFQPPVRLSGAPDDIDALKDLFLVLDALNYDPILNLWETTNARIYGAFQSFDAATKPACNPESQFLYAPAYKAFITKRIDDGNANLTPFINDALKGIPADDAAVADRLSSFTSRYPPASMTIPLPRRWEPTDPNDKVINGVYNWGVPGSAAGAAKRQVPAACPATTSSTVPMNATSIASGNIETGISRVSRVPIGSGGIPFAINSLGLGPGPTITPTVTPTITPVIDALVSSSSAAAAQASISAAAAAAAQNSASSVAAASASAAAAAAAQISASSVSAATASTATSAAPAATGDPCGPTTQGPGYANTCDAKAGLATTPQQYGVFCGTEPSSSDSIDWTSCEAAYKTTCQNIQYKAFPAGAWVWSDPGAGCAVGVWIPNAAGAAKIPSIERCTDSIYGAMVTNCRGDVFSATKYNVGSVNLASLPLFSNPTQSGSQVNAGYASYIIAPKLPQGLTNTWAGYTTTNVGAAIPSTDKNPNDQDTDAVQVDAGSDTSGQADTAAQPNTHAGGGGSINFI